MLTAASTIARMSSRAVLARARGATAARGGVGDGGRRKLRRDLAAASAATTTSLAGGGMRWLLGRRGLLDISSSGVDDARLLAALTRT